ncbi:MAG: RNase adapter RapZ [Bacillota bacterium]|nr:RNase adapter RapZ [Bacillota bacterium]
MEFVIISGLSGAGKTQVKKIFEDNEYYCIDNLPPALISNFIDLCDTNIENIDKVALVSDVRNKLFFYELSINLEKLKNKNFKYSILFLEADTQTLINRYKETRRTHPLKPNGSIEKAIEEEREILSELREKADYILKTDNYNLTELKNQINELFLNNDDNFEMNIVFKSFGFKKGIPLDADFVFDVRFLPNPYYIEDLRYKTGEDKEVRDYVMSFEESREIYKRIKSVVNYATEVCRKNERKQVIIAVGCTGGHHRSVTFINNLYDDMKTKYKNLTKIHRDIVE